MGHGDSRFGDRRRHTTSEHKVAISVRRAESRVVRSYLQALDGAGHRRRRRLNETSIDRPMAAIQHQLASAG